MRSPVSGDLLLSLAALSIPAVALQRDSQLIAVGLEYDRLDEGSNDGRRARAALLALQRQTRAANPLPGGVTSDARQLWHLRTFRSLTSSSSLNLPAAAAVPVNTRR